MKDTGSQELCAKIIDMLRSTTKSGYIRDYKTEMQLWDEVYAREKEYSYNFIKRQYEERLYTYTSSYLSYVKKDEWTGKPVIISYQEWYDYKLRINYTFEEKDITTEILYSSENKIHEGDYIYIEIDKSDPEKILSVSLYSDAFLRKSMLVLNMILCAFVLVSFIIMIMLKC